GDINENVDGQVLGAYQTGDLILNSGGDRPSSLPRYPVGWRPKKYGGGKAQLGASMWSAGMTIYTGQVISASPDTVGHSLFQAQNAGTTGGVRPSFNDTQGATYMDNGIQWLQIGPNGGDFEPIITESPSLATIDVTTTPAPTGDAVAYARIKLTNASANFNLTIEGGAAGGWDRVIWNSSGFTATIKGCGGDPGVSIPNGSAYHLPSDGARVVHVT